MRRNGAPTEENHSTERVAIIGAGWAGLSAAIELSTAGIPVTVYEAARHTGGRARGVPLLGHKLDNGPHLLIGAYQETLRLLKQIGVSLQESLWRQPFDVLVPSLFRMKLPAWPVPLNLMAGLLTLSGASWQDRFNAISMLAHLRRNHYRLPADRTLTELLTRFKQDGAHSNLGRYLWEPLCLAALNTPAQRASAQIFANVLRDSLAGPAGATDWLIPQTDLSTLFLDPACRFIEHHQGEIRLSTRVTSLQLQQDDDRKTQIRVNDETFAAAILATNPVNTISLLEQATPFESTVQALQAISYEPIGAVYVRSSPAIDLPAALFALPGPVGQWLFDLQKTRHIDGMLCFVLSGKGHWETLTQEALIDTLMTELALLLNQPPLTSSVIDAVVIREHRGTFSCRPEMYRLPAVTPWPPLFMAGDLCWAEYPATLEGAVRSGTSAARHCREFITATR